MKTDRATLSLLTESAFDEVLKMFKEPETFKYIKPFQNKTRGAYLEFLKLKIRQIESGKGYYWVIRSIYSSDFIGAINLTPIPGTGQIQIGWQIKNKFRRQGYAYETAKAALEFALAETKFRPIYAVFEKGNVASEKILKKLNFNFHETEIKDTIELKKYIYDS